METIVLTTPELIPAVTTTDYRVVSLLLDWAGGAITVVVRGTNGEQRSYDYTGATALTMMTALNKADLSAKSLQRRILERLAADNKLTGVITGVPD